MSDLWTERSRYQFWLQVELAVCEELAQKGKIPERDWKDLKSAVDSLLQKGGVDPESVAKHEEITRHDVIAFTTAVAEELGPISRYIHFGLTSSDVVDTALSMQIQAAGRKLLNGVDTLLDALLKRANQYKDLPTIGRSHGISAEPTSFGLKFLGWFAEWKRNRERLSRALDGLKTGKLSGAVGVNAHWPPDFEARVLKRLGLSREPISTQVIPRDRHAEFMNVLAICGSSMERIAVELRHLQRTEVGEVQEGFRKGQKGSSAMPHKRNPISSENLTGLSRLLRSHAIAALENVALWHERDISHSSVERIIFPDGTILLDYALHRLTNLIENLVVHDEQVRRNLERVGKTVFSGHFLLALVEKGATREEAYSWVQKCALESLDNREKDFVDLLANHKEISSRLTRKEIEKLGSLSFQLKNVDEIYRSV